MSPSTFNESDVARQKAGQPTGGQFAEKAKAASGLSLQPGADAGTCTTVGVDNGACVLTAQHFGSHKNAAGERFSVEEDFMGPMIAFPGGKKGPDDFGVVIENAYDYPPTGQEREQYRSATEQEYETWREYHEALGDLLEEGWSEEEASARATREAQKYADRTYPRSLAGEEVEADEAATEPHTVMSFDVAGVEGQFEVDTDGEEYRLYHEGNLVAHFTYNGDPNDRAELQEIAAGAIPLRFHDMAEDSPLLLTDFDTGDPAFPAIEVRKQGEGFVAEARVPLDLDGYVHWRRDIPEGEHADFIERNRQAVTQVLADMGAAGRLERGGDDTYELIITADLAAEDCSSEITTRLREVMPRVRQLSASSQSPADRQEMFERLQRALHSAR